MIFVASAMALLWVTMAANPRSIGLSGDR